MIPYNFRKNSMLKIRSIFTLILIWGKLFFNCTSGAVISSKTSSIGNEIKSNTQKVCQKQECKDAASKILSSIDETIDPCEDFYNFSCGNFIKSTIIPSYLNSMTSLDIMRNEVVLKMKEILEGDKDYIESVDIETPKRAYKACMNITDVEQNGLKRLMKVLSDLRGMPILMGNSWSEKEFDLIEVVRKLRTMGYPSDQLLSISSLPNALDLTYYSLWIKRPDVTAVNYYNVYKTQAQFMKDAFSLLKADNLVMLKDIQDMLMFELRLLGNGIKKQFVEINSITDFTDNPVMPLQKYVKNLLPENFKVPSENGTIIVDIAYVDYFARLINLTPKRVVANYLLWKVIVWSIEESLLTEFDISASKTYKERPPRYRTCVTRIIDAFPNIQAAYLKTYFTEKRKRSAEIYTNNLQKALQDIIREKTWIDESTKQEIIEKIENIQKFVGYSEVYTESDDEMKRAFDENLKNGIYQEFYLKASKIKIDKELARWGKTVYKNTWPLLQTDVNAMFTYITNSLYIPGGILTGNMFNENLPSYLNYGGLGFIAGHELSHTIDPEGMKHDKNGMLNRTWYKEIAVEYNEKVNCIAVQYENYTVGKVKLDTRSTLKEDMADLSGVKVAYTAYINSDKANETEPLLPGLNYNQRQLFWINLANSWCSKDSQYNVLRQVQSSSHGLHGIRILRSFSNSEEFSKDFNCPVGSRMNPKNKCLL